MEGDHGVLGKRSDRLSLCFYSKLLGCNLSSEKLEIDKLLDLHYISEINTLGMTVKILLKKVRKDRNLSINDMARLTGLSPQYLGKLEKNKGNPSLSVLNTLCKCLSVNPGDLLEYSDD